MTFQGMIVKGTREATAKRPRHATEHTPLSNRAADTATTISVANAFLAKNRPEYRQTSPGLRCPEPIRPVSPAFSPPNRQCVPGQAPALLAGLVTLGHFPRKVWN